MTVPSISAFGLTLALPTGWEARVYRRAPIDAVEQTFPVLHAATFPLPPTNIRGDFGSGAVDVMSPTDVFVCLFEYGPDAVGQAMFAHRGLPVLDSTMFSPDQLQRAIPGQSGCQRFFTERGRAFSLYVVMGSHANRRARLAAPVSLLQGLVVDAPANGEER